MIKSISKSKSNNNTNQKIINKYNDVKQVYKSPIIPKLTIIITFLPTIIIITFLSTINNLQPIFVKKKLIFFNSMKKFKITKFFTIFYYNYNIIEHDRQIKNDSSV